MINVIHGIRSDGAGNVDLLIPALESNGLEARNVDYPWIWAFQAALTPYWLNRRRQFRDAQILFEASNDGEDVVAHSRGALVTFRAMELGRRFRCVWLFSPALDEDRYFPPGGAEFIWVIHCPMDEAIRLAGVLPWNDFGKMGRVGYRGKVHDGRICNVRAEKHYPAHSHYFGPAFLSRWTRFILERSKDPEKYFRIDKVGMHLSEGGCHGSF